MADNSKSEALELSGLFNPSGWFATITLTDRILM